MKLRKARTAYKIEIAILLAVSSLFFISEYSSRYIVAAITLGVTLFGTVLYYGFKKDNEYFRWTATKIIVAILVSAYIIDLILGLSLGYNSTLFSLSFNRIINGILPICIIIVITEYLRFVVIKNNFTEKNVIYIMAVLMIVFNFVINYPINEIAKIDNAFIFIATIIIPLIARELLTSYITVNYGFVPAVIYKLIMNLYIYLIPATADIGDYLYSVVHLLIPYIIYHNLNRNIKVNNTTKKYIPKPESIASRFIAISVTVLSFVIIILVSGITDFQLIAIATDSMSATYRRGDAVIFERVEAGQVQLGDILVFKQKNTVVTHRVVNIKIDSNNLYFYTKGDYNKTNDSSPVAEKDVIGVVRNVVKYIGYPTIKINEIIEGGSIS